MTEPWGTPTGQGAIDDMTPCKFTCWVLPVRKHFTQDQKALDIFISASLNSRILWSTKSKALRKSRNIVWTPFPPSLELSVTSYQFWIIEIRAETVDRPIAKACWLFFISRPWILSFSCSFSSIVANWGSSEICRKSLLISFGCCILGTGEIIACLYAVGYLDCINLLVMILCAAGVNSSQ